MTGPITRPDIDILHELGNRALPGSKKSSPTSARSRRLTWRASTASLPCLSDWQHGAVSARAGHSRPTLDYKTFPGASLRYTPGGHRRGDTHARGGHTPPPTGYARGSAHSEPPRRARRDLPRAAWLLEAPAATARKSARIA